MKKANIVGASVSGLFSILVIIYTLSFPPGTSGVPGPGMFPIIVASLMLLSSLVVIGFAVFSKAADIPFSMKTPDNIRVYICMVIMATYIFLVPRLGFCVSSTVYLAALMKWFSGHHIIRCALYAALVTAVVFLVFSKVLLVPLSFGLLL